MTNPDQRGIRDLSPPAAAVMLGAGLIAVLVLVSAMPPLGTAAYLTGLPMAAEDLGITTAAAQYTLTVYIVGMAIGQLIIGPLSDRIGRKTPLMIGIGAFVIFSVAIAFSPNLTVMLVFRTLQGVAASSGMVLGRVIVHDIVQGDAAARALNVIMAVGLIVPALAPLLGSAVLAFADWRAIFIVLAAIGAAVGAWAMVKVPESHPGRHVRVVAKDSKPAARPRPADAPPPSMMRFVMYTVTVSMAFMAMYAYVGSAPFIFQQLHGFSPAGYAWTGAGLSILMAVVGLSVARFIGRKTRFGVFSASAAVTISIVVMVVGALLVGVAVMTEAPVALYIAALAVATLPSTIIFGSSTALAMDASPLPGGTSSAILGFTQSMFGAATPPLVGIMGVDARPMAVVLLAAALLALTAASLGAVMGGRRTAAVAP